MSNPSSFVSLAAMMDYTQRSGKDATIKGKYAILRVRWKHSKIWFFVNGWHVKKEVAQAICSYINEEG